MLVQFTTSTAGPRGAFMEGQVVEVPDRPVPVEFLAWLQAGVVRAIKHDSSEVTLPPDAVELAIARRTRPRGRGRRGTTMPAPAKTPSTDAPAVPRLLRGGTVVCLGGGPSLTAEDVAAVRSRAVVVAINDVYKLAPWAEVLYAADAKWWKWHHGAPSFPGMKFTLQPEAARWPGVQVLQNTGERGLETAPTGLRTGRNSGYQAINLAVHLGATRVLLLGYDMGPDGTKTHWFGDHPDKAPSPYAVFLERFGDLVVPLRQVGVEVINCSRRTALTTFPRLTLEEALC